MKLHAGEGSTEKGPVWSVIGGGLRRHGIRRVRAGHFLKTAPIATVAIGQQDLPADSSSGRLPAGLA